MSKSLIQKSADAVRFLSIDSVTKANSGHPGMPMGMADIATVLWTKFLKHNPKNPNWINRDRFILSNGHGSALLYSLLHLSGYNLSLDDLKSFRQLHSKTPGHPEYGYTDGVETTTGPLGQGIANAVGMALGEKLLSTQFNEDNNKIINHYTYTFLGDGCLMEGVSHEACSLAGTLGLGKLIAFWDDNSISIDGDVKGWFTENVVQRYKAYGWQVIENIDGHNMEEIEEAIKQAQLDTDKPTLICCKTTIGYGSPTKAGTASVHGSPLSSEERNATAENLGWEHAEFEVPKEIYDLWNSVGKGADLENQWKEKYQQFKSNNETKAKELERRLSGNLVENLDEVVAEYIKNQIEAKPKVATRKASQMALEVLCSKLPEMFGGSADLTGSNNTNYSGSNWMNNGFSGANNYLSYGVREFGMAAIMNGLSLYGGFKPYGGTFLVFSDYSRNAIRMSALMKLPIVHVMTHDSIGLGEDGPTHQPVEHVPSLRLIPRLNVWRPADTVETMVAWHSSVKSTDNPSTLVLTRQGLPAIVENQNHVEGAYKGAYLLKENNDAKVTLVATGSEVDLAIKTSKLLEEKGILANIVSAPCLEIFDEQSQEYKHNIIKQNIPAIFIELSNADSWYKYMPKAGGQVVGMKTFGESAPANELMEYFGFTAEKIAKLV